MNHFIERYVYDVTRRLPEEEREEIRKELIANIYDMLSEDATQDEIESVLYHLGSPSALAEKYRSKPRYLISPALYDDYIRTLKLVLPLVGILLLGLGMLLGAIHAIRNGTVDVSYFVRNFLSAGISWSLSSMFQALVWITIGFAIAERIGSKTDKQKEPEWNINDLPELLPNGIKKIPLSDSITELVLTIVFSAIAIAYCSGALPIALSISMQRDNVVITNFFNPDFLKLCIPAISIMALLGIAECICKIKERIWTPLVCFAVIISNLISMVIFLYLLNRPNIISSEFQAFLQNSTESHPDFLRFLGQDRIDLSILVFSIIIVSCILIECCAAVYKTLKNRTQNTHRST